MLATAPIAAVPHAIFRTPAFTGKKSSVSSQQLKLSILTVRGFEHYPIFIMDLRVEGKHMAFLAADLCRLARQGLFDPRKSA
jgi:hypothetical protein